jgi:hypothetical protein
MSILGSKPAKVIYNKVVEILSATNFIFGSSHESLSNALKIQLFYSAGFLLSPKNSPCSFSCISQTVLIWT